MVLDIAKHYPVLLNELISIISPQHGGTFIDCTFGQGGYTRKILSHENTRVIAIDRDIELSLIHISEPTRLRRISYAVFCLKKKKQ